MQHARYSNSIRLALGLALAFVALAATGLLVADEAQGQAIISNGFTQLGVVNQGALNLAGGTASCGSSTSTVGIRHVPTNCEATAPGCLCEGWGLAYDGSTTGSCNMASGCPSGVLSTCLFTSTLTEATSTCKVGDLQIKHEYKPSPAAPEVYRVYVEIENQGTVPHSDVKYRRAMDWDAEPTAFSEYVTIDGVSPMPSVVTYFSNDGFSSSNPLTAAGGMRSPCTGIPASTFFTDCGPGDHGAVFDFNFGTLTAGEVRSFLTFYGTTANETAADTVVSTEGMSIWTYGQCDGARNAGCSHLTGTTVTYIWGFGGLDAKADFIWIPEPPCHDELVTFTDNSTAAVGGTVTQWKWTMGVVPPDVFTFTSAPADVVDYAFPGAGTYPVSLNVTTEIGLEVTYSEITKDVYVMGCPTAMFGCETSTSPYLRVDFTDFSVDPDWNIVSWYWEFGDGGTSTERHPKHDYAAEGYYSVKLTITDADGNTATATNLCFADLNNPPIIDPIPIQVVYEGDPVHFDVTGRDPDGDDIHFSWIPAKGLPSNAQWTAATMAFHWDTFKGSKGYYAPSTFFVSDWEFTVSTEAAIIVLAVPPVEVPENYDADGDGKPDQQDECPAIAGDCSGLTFAGSAYDDLMDRLDPPAETPADTPASSEEVDTDGDGHLDRSDNCVLIRNTDQVDTDGDGQGDVCDADIDGDRVNNVDASGRLLDNCPYTPNLFQEDTDGDGFGDACDGDVDADGIPDAVDNCPVHANALQTDSDANGIGDDCEEGTAQWTAPAPASKDAEATTENDATVNTAASTASVWPWTAAIAGVLVVLGSLVAFLALRRKE